MKRVFLPTAAVAVLAATVAHAQTAQDVRDGQARMLDLQRSVLVNMADSMPEALYRDKATPIQRDFAQQLYHAASAVAFVAQRYAGAQGMPAADTAAVFNTRAGMVAYVNAVYDAAIAALRAQSDADRLATVDFFGMMEIPGWQVWDEIHLHTMWTAGQVVANFRKHGMGPPAFTFF